jgi:predicted transcriptional regulator
MNKYTDQMMTCEQHLFLDDRISLKAKGMYAILMSIEKPFTMKDIKECTSSGMVAVRTAFNELKEKGFIETTQVRENGRIVGVNYRLTSPKTE